MPGLSCGIFGSVIVKHWGRTLPRKFEVVHSTTTRRRRHIPRVLLAIPIFVGCASRFVDMFWNLGSETMPCEFGRACIDSVGSQARYLQRKILIMGICGTKGLQMRLTGRIQAPEEGTTDPPSGANVRVRAEMPGSVRMKIGDKQRSPISIQGPGDQSSLAPHCAGKITFHYN